MSKKKIPQRAGAAALAAATVVSGLAFGPGAVAAPVQSTGSTPVVLPAAEDPRHVVGPLVLQTGASQYTGVFGNTENHPRNGSLFPTLAQARGEATNWSMPAFDGKGEIRSLDRDECIETYGPDQYGVYLRPCTGAANQQWSWIDAHNPFGANTKTLVADSNPERAMLNRNETGTTYLVNRPIAESKPFVLDDAMVETRGLSASASGHLDSATVTISGTATPGSSVSAAGSSDVAASDGRFSFDVPGVGSPQRIRVTETLSNGVVWGETDVDAVPGADFGSMSPVEAPSTALTRGDDTTVQAFLSVASRVTSITSTVTFTAPSGTTFSDSVDGSVQYRKPDSSQWMTSAYARLSGRVVSDDKKTVTYDLRTQKGFDLPDGTQLRFNAVVSAPGDALDQGDLALGLTLAGTTDTGTFRVTTSAPVSIAGDFGSVSALEVPSVDLPRGEVSDVRFMVRNSAAKTGFAPRVVLTAPEGTTFPAQSTAEARYRGVPNGDWRPSAGLDLKNGVVSNDGKTLTFDNSTDPVSTSADRDYEYTVKVEVAPDAPSVENNAMGFEYSGTSTQGRFGTSGSAPVVVRGDFGSVSALEMPSVDLPRGEVSDVRFMVRNSAAKTGFAPRVVLTAPEGTTFPAQSTAEARYRGVPNGDWRPSAGLDLKNGVVSNDGKTLTFDNSTDPVSTSADRDYEYTVKVEVAQDAPGLPLNALTFEYSCTSTQGRFGTSGSVPITFPGDFGTVSASEIPGVELTPGTDTDVSFRVHNTEARTGFAPRVVLTAPEGTTFTGQTTASGRYRVAPDGQWYSSDLLTLHNGVVSDDGKTLSFDNSSNGIAISANRDYEYVVSVSTPANAKDVDGNAMTFVYSGTSAQGSFRATGAAPVSIVSAYTDVTLDNPSDGDTFSPGEVEFTGTGTPGATVTVAPSVGAAVVTEVRGDGTWRAVRYLGHANYVMSVSQKAASGENTIENIRLFSDQAATLDFAVTSPVSGAGHTQQGWVTFSGTGTTWSTVSISDGSSVAPTTATVQYDGSWTARRWVGTERTTFTVTSARAGVENGSQSIEFNTGVSGREFTLDSHSDGDTFTPGNVVFRGTGSTGDEVTFSAPGLAPLKATVNAAGEWSIPRWLGNGYITFEVTHTPVVGEPTQQTLRLYSDQVASGPLVVTSPIDGSGHEQQGWVTFSGTGTTWSTVSISDGTGVTPSRATVQYDGSWTVNRWVGTNPVTFTVTSARAGVENGRETIEFNVGDADDDFSFDSHADGGTFTPGNVVFSGKGSTGDKVTMVAPGLAPLEAEVDARGDWRIQRWLGNGFITFEVTHTPVTGAPTQQTLRLFSDQVPQGELVVTSPLDGASHDQAGYVTFTGTGTTWSKVSISDGSNAAPSTATVQYDGSWTVQRWVGTDPVTFTVTSQRADVANGSETIRFNGAE